MTDKEKIKAEIERLKNKDFSGTYDARYALDRIIDFVNSLSEESVSSIWHDVIEEPKPNMELICVGQYGNPLVLSSNSDFFKSRDISKWAYFNDLLNLSNIQRTTNKWKEPVSEDLGEYINELSKQFPEVSFAKLSRIAVRVAKWQKEQFEKNRLKHCNSITNEQAELEQGFIDQHIDKYNRMPTFLDAIEYGMRLQKQQIEEALLSEVLPCFMHGGEADEVVAKLDEVLNKKK